MADYWDFMYYAFTIAMCFSDLRHLDHLGEDAPRHLAARDFLVSVLYGDHRLHGQRDFECHVSVSRGVIPVSTVLIAVALAASSGMAQSEIQSDETSAAPPGPRPKRKPIDLEIEAPSLDFTQDVTKFLNDFRDKYRGYKKELRIWSPFNNTAVGLGGSASRCSRPSTGPRPIPNLSKLSSV
jgi:hypothetical protein